MELTQLFMQRYNALYDFWLAGIGNWRQMI